MVTLELFAGSGSFSRQARKRGWQTLEIDKYQFKGTDLVQDILTVTPELIRQHTGPIDILWASPPCNYFSLNSASLYWDGLEPKSNPRHDWFLSDEPAPAWEGIRWVQHTQYLIESLQPRYWFVENPVGMLRKLPYMQWAPVHQTIDYCQYGDLRRKKPTDIWSNVQWPARRRCKPAYCYHQRTRGHLGGTRGLPTSYERSQIPPQLFNDIFDWILTQ